MNYVRKDLYYSTFRESVSREPNKYQAEKGGYSVLHHLCPSSFIKEEADGYIPIKFVVMLRTTKTNLILVKDNSFAIPVDVESPPDGATFDDLIMLHAKELVESAIVTSDIQNFIAHSCIQPWGVVITATALYVPVELIIDDKMLENRVFEINSAIVNKTLKDENSLPNGLTPIAKVKQYNEKVEDEKQTLIDTILFRKLKEI